MSLRTETDPSAIEALAGTLGLEPTDLHQFFGDARDTRPRHALGVRGHGLRSAPVAPPLPRSAPSTLQALRRRAGLSQERAAAAIGTSPG